MFGFFFFFFFVALFVFFFFFFFFEQRFSILLIMKYTVTMKCILVSIFAVHTNKNDFAIFANYKVDIGIRVYQARVEMYTPKTVGKS